MIDDDDFNIEITIEDTEESKPSEAKKEKDPLTNFDKTWIGVPTFENGKKVREETKEIGQCSSREVYNWAVNLYPLVGSLGYQPTDFQSRKEKVELFYLVIQGLKTMGVVTK